MNKMQDGGYTATHECKSVELISVRWKKSGNKSMDHRWRRLQPNYNPFRYEIYAARVLDPEPPGSRTRLRNNTRRPLFPLPYPSYRSIYPRYIRDRRRVIAWREEKEEGGLPPPEKSAESTATSRFIRIKVDGFPRGRAEFRFHTERKITNSGVVVVGGEPKPSGNGRETKNGRARWRVRR